MFVTIAKNTESLQESVFYFYWGTNLIPRLRRLNMKISANVEALKGELMGRTTKANQRVDFLPEVT